MCDITQKGQKSPVKGHSCALWLFTPHLFKFRKFITHYTTPREQHAFLEFLVENKAFYSKKRALHADTTCNKLLK